jgi:hypothetical protein
MGRRTWNLLTAGLASLAFVAAPSTAEPPRDRGKAVIELPVQNVVAAAQPAPRLADYTKGRIEGPVQGVAAASAPARAAAVKAALKANNTGFVNPKVEPGKVAWHRDLAAASVAAGKSGKPILVFHMMGKLDDQFC